MTFDPHTYLNTFVNFESCLHKMRPEGFHLGRVHQLLAVLGHPHKKLKVIHVAGTKGKGSTCAMLASILQQAGFKVGLYTSPHLHHPNERIRILHQSNLSSHDEFAGSISDEKLAKMISLARPSIASVENRGIFLTYFEVLTVLAALYFVQEKADFVILETGLGGRLDATNAFDAMVSILTPISLDHTNILGNSLKEIAIEKAGIIKNFRQQVVMAPQEDVPIEVLKNRCHEFDITPRMADPDRYKHLDIALKGEHQRVNASCAVQAIECLKEKGFVIAPQAIEQGLKLVRWFGRFEVVQQNPAVVLDGAHNSASAAALVKTVLDEYPRRKIVIVLGLSKDKDIKSVCAQLKEISNFFILTKSNHPRSHIFNHQQAQDLFIGKEWFITENVADALTLAFSKTNKEDVIVVTGSLFVVAQARENLCISLKV